MLAEYSCGGLQPRLTEVRFLYMSPFPPPVSSASAGVNSGVLVDKANSEGCGGLAHSAERCTCNAEVTGA